LIVVVAIVGIVVAVVGMVYVTDTAPGVEAAPYGEEMKLPR
jgi:hypothetical protein